jgi:hypothetical protein
MEEKMRTSTKTFLGGATCCACLLHTALADIHYVAITNTTPAFPYISWETAAINIQDAVNAATNGDTVLIADGTYEISSKINVTKSLVIQSVNGPDAVVVDANEYSRVFTLSSETGSIVLDGLTLTGGYANHAVTLGGAIFAFGNSDIRIANCIVENNGSPGSAGGININANAGKHITATITNCLVRNNQASNKGGGIGINIGGSCQISIIDCTVEGNAAQNGGGIWCNAPNGSIDISRCLIMDNVAANLGGGIRLKRNCQLTDSLIIGNLAETLGGGGVYGGLNGNSHVANCTITENRARWGGGAQIASIINSIVYSNSANAVQADISPSCFAAFTCSPDLTNGVNGNINANPQFVDAASGDYRLLATSPCVDAGTNTFVVSTVDLDWHPRIVDGDLNGDSIVDMGAYEFLVLPIEIDIKPGSDTNPVHLNSKGRCPVAVLTTNDFDASEIDPATIRFTGAVPAHMAYEDVDTDGDLDLLLHFNTQELHLTSQSYEAMIIGQTYGGQLLAGIDTINTVP